MLAVVVLIQFEFMYLMSFICYFTFVLCLFTQIVSWNQDKKYMKSGLGLQIMIISIVN